MVSTNETSTEKWESYRASTTTFYQEKQDGMLNDETPRTRLRNRASSLNIPTTSPKTRKVNRKRKMTETNPAEMDDPKRIKTEYD